MPLKVTGMVEVTTLQPWNRLSGACPEIYDSPFCARTRSTQDPGTNRRPCARSPETRPWRSGSRLRSGRARSQLGGTALLWKMLFHLDDIPNYWKLRRELRETFEETWTSQFAVATVAFPSHLLLASFWSVYEYDRFFFGVARQPRRVTPGCSLG